MTVLDVGCGMGFFSMGLARLVGDEGQVIAADVQEKMLKVLVKRADRAGISGRIHPHKCEPNQLGVESIVDFILAFWMVHEVPDKKMFFRQARSCLKSKGKMLIAEPKFHVSLKRFHAMLDSARESGLNPSEAPSIRFSRSVVLENNSL
jgi:ubiquinone/menaquinone biosynthesis C-methylase UbiE